jgi:hypothetical protein
MDTEGRAEQAENDSDGWKLLYQDALARELKQQARAETAEAEVAFANALAETRKAGMKKVQDRNALLVAREEAAKAEVERLRAELDDTSARYVALLDRTSDW